MYISCHAHTYVLLTLEIFSQSIVQSLRTNTFAPFMEIRLFTFCHTGPLFPSLSLPLPSVTSWTHTHTHPFAEPSESGCTQHGTSILNTAIRVGHSPRVTVQLIAASKLSHNVVITPHVHSGFILSQLPS